MSQMYKITFDSKLRCYFSEFDSVIAFADKDSLDLWIQELTHKQREKLSDAHIHVYYYGRQEKLGDIINASQ